MKKTPKKKQFEKPKKVDEYVIHGPEHNVNAKGKPGNRLGKPKKKKDSPKK